MQFPRIGATFADLRAAWNRTEGFASAKTADGGAGTASAASTESAPQSGLKGLAEDLRHRADSATERCSKKAQPIPASLQDQLDALQEIITMQKQGKTLPMNRIAEIHNRLLADLSPTELTRLRDGLIEAQREAGRFVQVPKRLLPGTPASLGEVNSLLTGISGKPTSSAEALFGEATASNPQAAKALRHERQLFEDGATNPLPKLPSTLRSAARKQRRIESEISRVSTALQDPARASEHPKLRMELRSLVDAQRTLGKLVEQMHLSNRPTTLDRSSGHVGLIAGKALIPGTVSTFVEGGVRLSEKSVHTGKRYAEPYFNSGVTTPIAQGGYFASRSHKGAAAGVTLPYLGMGIHPVMGKTVCVFVPGVFTFQMGSAGALNIKLMAPIPGTGFFGGVAVMAATPKLAKVTSPAVELLFRGGQKLAEPLAPIAIQAGTLIRSLGRRASQLPRVWRGPETPPLADAAAAAR